MRQHLHNQPLPTALSIGRCTFELLPRLPDMAGTAKRLQVSHGPGITTFFHRDTVINFHPPSPTASPVLAAPFIPGQYPPPQPLPARRAGAVGYPHASPR